MNIYKYEVQYYCDESGEDNTSRGVVYAGRLSEAVDELAHYYGEDDIIRLTVNWYEEGAVAEEEEEEI